MRPTRYFICILLLVAIVSSAIGQTILIVNSANPDEGITRAEVSNIFLGNTSKWSNGVAIKPVDQKKATNAGTAFLAMIVKMTESAYNNLWVEKMLSGEADPPINLSSDAEVVEFVKVNAGAVGYISSSTPHEGVKVLPIDGNKEW